jgi:lysophospholipase L1-like esterase
MRWNTMRASRVIAIALLAMIASPPRADAAEQMKGESLVLAGETPARLFGESIDPESVVVRSTYREGSGTVYEAGRDYKLDPRSGTIARLPGSRIPDYSANMLFGKKDFNHGQFPGYGNTKFFVYVDYKFDGPPPKLTEPRDVAPLLPKTLAKLRTGAPLKVIAFGDSIAAGGETSAVELQFPLRYIEHLKARFPTAKITFENGSTGGDNTVMGLARIEEKVLSRSPGLVLVAFGMNDHNVGGVPPAEFKANLKQIVGRIREKTGAEVILLSTFPPHPDWHFGSHQMGKYADATKAAAEELRAPYADVYGVWQTVLKRKDPASLLANNINHPNDFGHWLYLQALAALEL